MARRANKKVINGSKHRNPWEGGPGSGHGYGSGGGVGGSSASVSAA